jgi:putative tricarboxylic transport membrane protein
MRKGNFPAAPLILALILGPILERSLQQALLTSGGSPMIFIDRPISAALLLVGAAILLLPLLKLFGPRMGSSVQ